MNEFLLAIMVTCGWLVSGLIEVGKARGTCRVDRLSKMLFRLGRRNDHWINPLWENVAVMCGIRIVNIECEDTYNAFYFD